MKQSIQKYKKAKFKSEITNRTHTGLNIQIGKINIESSNLKYKLKGTTHKIKVTQYKSEHKSQKIQIGK